MEKDLFDSFPYAIIRIDPANKVIQANARGQDLLKQVNNKFWHAAQEAKEWDTTKSWVSQEGEVFCIQTFWVEGHEDSLIMVSDEPELLSALPACLEEKLEDFTNDSYVITHKISELIQSAFTFERFDLLRVDPRQRKYIYEYSIGIDIVGTLHTAYSTITDSGLGWIVQHEAPILVENLTPERFMFREDPMLYQTGFKSVLRVPIMFDHGAVGAILLASSCPGEFQIEDAMLVDLISRLIAQPFFHAGIMLQHEYQTLASAALLNTVISAMPESDLELFLMEYCNQLRESSKLDRVGVFLLDPPQTKRLCIAEAGKELVGFGEWIPINHSGGVSEMLRSKSVVAFNLADPRYEHVEDSLKGRGFTAIVYVPIENNEGDIVACLTGVSSDERALSFTIAGIFKSASEQLGQVIARSTSNLRLETPKTTEQDSEVPPSFHNIIGLSQVMKDTIHRAATAAKYNFPILITGETGTGKELFAKAIHEASNTAQGPFIVVNSAAIPANLLESELFGYQEGAFTGGLKGGKKGKILMADKGTLFLDEIGELSPDLQAKLLRVIQEQEVEPVGAVKPIPVNVRFISATHRDLHQMVKKGEFREDLLYRLNAIEVRLPPLRERGHDILELAYHMLKYLSLSHGTPLKRLSAEAEQALLKYSWPGNVRQLQNIINRLFVFVDGLMINAGDLPPDIRNIPVKGSSESDKERMESLLLEFGGNKTALAHYLGITRTGLWKKLKRLGIQ